MNRGTNLNLAEEARRLVQRTTTTQGLPERVEDETVLEKVAALLSVTVSA